MFDDKTAVDPCRMRARIAEIFTPHATIAEAIRFETVLAQVQAEHGIIPVAAARAIAHAAAQGGPEPEAVVRHRQRVGHPMVAILDAFSESLDEETAEWLHYGTTTADVFRTVRMVQLHRVVDELLTAMRRIEGQMADLALRHRATPMIGRTLGRHALPITFGYKVATWLTAQRADIERLLSWQERFASGVLSGAVGTHAVMGAAGRKVEEDVMQRLGLGRPQIVDSKGRTDVFADFAAALAITARNQAHVAQEVFLLQGDDIREVSLASTAVGSSTMPHKSNPTACIEVMSRAREVAAALPVMLEWILIIYERDTAQHGALLEEMCIDMGQIVSCTEGMFAQLVVHPDHMRHNLGRTRGAILTEGVTADLALAMGRRSAHHLMREISARMAEENLSLAEVMAMDERTAHVAVPREDEAYGLAPQMVDDCLRDLGLLPG